ncbi:MAG TPA: hypothetical protein VGE36_04440 [Roseateles sp.]
MSVHPNNFLALEPHLVARVRAAVADLAPAVFVLTVADLADVREAAQRVPAVHVIWNGFKVDEVNGAGTKARLAHTWLAVAAVRNVADTRSGGAARQEAGELLARAGGALMGFQPPGAVKPLRLAPAPRSWASAGFLYVPMAFIAETLFSN